MTTFLAGFASAYIFSGAVCAVLLVVLKANGHQSDSAGVSSPAC